MPVRLTVTKVVFEFFTGSEPPKLNVGLTVTKVVFELSFY